MDEYQRILVIGSPGAGKSTFAKELSKIIGIPVYHLDKVYWLPNFEKPNEDDFINKVDEIITKDEWIIDGNYGSTLEKRLSRATLVFFLDYSKYLCVKSVLKRIKQYENIQRDDITEGCIETYDPEFLEWVWSFPELYRPRIIDLLSKYDVKVISFKTREEASHYLDELKNR